MYSTISVELSIERERERERERDISQLREYGRKLC
jgi:hypothetical protein